MEVPLQKWGNILGVNEFEVVTHHLRDVLTNDVSNLRRLDIEYVEEIKGEENEQGEGPENYKETVLTKHDHMHTHN